MGILSFSVVFLSTIASAASYRAAVLEFSPQQAPSFNMTRAEADAHRLMNARAIQEYMVLAKQNGSQIFVSPEYGITADGIKTGSNEQFDWTRAAVVNFSEPVPALLSTPCDDDEAASFPLTAWASCTARELGMVFVLNFIDSVPCKDMPDMDCKFGDGLLLFNAAIAVDEQGRLIAKYHKHHLFGDESKYMDRGNSPNGTQFKTSFGVEFGMFICFDIMFNFFPSPDIKHFAFPTDWVNARPLENALEAQRAWTGLHRKTMLASDYGGFGKASSGSGIWVDGTALASYQNLSPEPDNKLLMADVPM